MKSTPILMAGPMVRAVLNGTKRQTRRIVKGAPVEWSPVVETFHPTKVRRDGEEHPGAKIFGASDETFGIKCPYGKPGDELWVKETWAAPPSCNWLPPRDLTPAHTPIRYAMDGVVHGDSIRFDDGNGRFAIGKNRPSIFMPRWASRITLRITDVRVERLQDISTADAIAEGVFGDACYSVEPPLPYPVATFKALWTSINGPDSWELNPWVWVVSFERIKP